MSLSNLQKFINNNRKIKEDILLFIFGVVKKRCYFLFTKGGDDGILEQEVFMVELLFLTIYEQ